MEKLNLTFTSNPTKVGLGQELVIEDLNGCPLRVLVLEEWSTGLGMNSQKCWVKIVETDIMDSLVPIVDDNGVARIYQELYDSDTTYFTEMSNRYKLPVLDIQIGGK